MRSYGETTPPPDEGLQAERTSLSWVRTWALLALVLLFELRLLGQVSAVAAAAFAALLVVPAVGVLRVRFRHEQRVRRFIGIDSRDDAGHRERDHSPWMLNALVVGCVLIMAAVGVVVAVVDFP